MSFKVGKPEGLNPSDSEDEAKPRRPKGYLPSPRRVRSPSPEHPAWGFGDSRAPSRAEYGERASSRADFGERTPSRARSNSRTRGRNQSRAQSRSRTYDLYSPDGLSYDDVVSTSTTGNSLLPEGAGPTRRTSRASIKSNGSSRWRKDLDSFKAIKITFYKNGDQWFEGFDFRFRPAKDYLDISSLLERISARIDFNSPVTHLFDTDGHRVEMIGDLEDKKSYVASNSRKFKAGNYGKTGGKFQIKKKKTRLGSIGPSRVKSGSSRTSSSDSKPGSANSKVIKIVNSQEPTINEKVLLNMRTSQTFEEVLQDLGDVLEIKDADRMYTAYGEEVKSFSHLRNDFSDHEVFVISSGAAQVSPSMSQMILEGSDVQNQKNPRRSKSTSKDRNSTNTIEVLINGARKVYHPPNGLQHSTEAPDVMPALDWLFGSGGSDLKVLDTGELVYSAGAVVVIYNRMEERQRHYQGHSEDVTCLELHPGGELAGSGQREGGEGREGAHCRVWNVFTVETLAVLGLGECREGIAGISFSKLNKGQYLAVVDDSKKKTLLVWDWKTEDMLATAVIKTGPVSGVAFHPFDSNLMITFGAGGHLAFWNRKKDGFFARADMGEPDPGLMHTCVTFLDSGDLVVGDSEGNISTYTVSEEGEYFKSLSVEAHIKGVSALFSLGEGVLVSCGSQEGRLVTWDSSQDFSLLKKLELPRTAGSAVAVVQGRRDSGLYVATSNKLVLEGGLQGRFRVLLFGHLGRITAVAARPGEVSFVSAGEDRLVAMWQGTRLGWKVALQTAATALCYHPEGSVVALATADGHMVVLIADTGVHLTTTRLGKETIAAVKFNRAGDMVAAAATDGSIYLNKFVRDGFTKVGKMSAGLELAELDWDQTGDYLQTSSKDFTLQFWNTSSCKVERSASLLQEAEWADPSCLVGWAVAGVWGNQHYSAPATVTSLHAAPQAQLLATGDSHGALRLFRHPCTSPKAEFHQSRLLSGPLDSVRILETGDQLLAAGGRQGAVFRLALQ